MRLYGYWRSSASWRVRIGLALKGMDVDCVAVNLRQGDQHSDDHRDINPLAQVPVLEWEEAGQTRRLTQSLAILQWLDAVEPSPSLVPQSPWERARAWQLSEIINAGTQPLQNLSTQRAVAAEGQTDGREWCRHFIDKGLTALEALVAHETTPFLAGDVPTIADCCLIPQLYNARRFGCDMDQWPRLLLVEAHALSLPAFIDTHPERQPDAH